MLEKWTTTSSPCSREMNPKPFSALKNLTVPCATNTRFSARQTNQFGLLATSDCTQQSRIGRPRAPNRVRTPHDSRVSAGLGDLGKHGLPPRRAGHLVSEWPG